MPEDIGYPASHNMTTQKTLLKDLYATLRRSGKKRKKKKTLKQLRQARNAQTANRHSRNTYAWWV